MSDTHGNQRWRARRASYVHLVARRHAEHRGAHELRAAVEAERPAPVDALTELGRFVLLDEVAGNWETWFLARCLDELRRAVVDVWEVVGPCELCERTLFDDEGRSLGGEDAGDACPACYAEVQEVQAERERLSNRATCDTAWWCPACSYGVELGEAAQTDLVPTADTRAVCPHCGAVLEAA